MATFVALIGGGVLTGAPATFVPKLALDLEGGTQIILSPALADGEQVSAEELTQAVGIIRQRVDSSGVSESLISTQGNSNIVVQIPGTPSDSTLALIRSSAKLEFRPVILTNTSTSTTVGGENGASASPSAETEPTVKPTDFSDPNWVTPAIQSQFDALDCSKQFRQPGQIDDPTKPLVTCGTDGFSKYVLGPVELDGENIADATNGTTTTTTGASTNTWAVNLSFNDEGREQFKNVTTRLVNLADPRNRFAITLDGFVITAPTTQSAITGGEAQITGSFDQNTSKALADQLKYGSLPISFIVQSQENISPTLGGEQLAAGLLAGFIGLILVVIYSLFQYRALAVVTIGSLIVAAALVYLVIAFLSWRIDYRLSLAGVAGLIVAIGVTADSFIVYFERVRDELRDGRPLSAAVEAGWKRAFRTIVVSDAVSMLAAIVLYVLTVGNVKGFAFTLGLTTIIDLLVVVLFTHPLLQLLAQTRFFSSGNKWSGFDSKALGGAVYRGRMKFATSDRIGESKLAKANKEANKRQTLAERKAAEAEGDK
jgi:preprotein translocase subunit SecD